MNWKINIHVNVLTVRSDVYATVTIIPIKKKMQTTHKKKDNKVKKESVLFMPQQKSMCIAPQKR